MRKKWILGSVLCLSVLTIIISIIRFAVADVISEQYDPLWPLLWIQVEPCVAVIAVSFTIFRSLFLSDASKASKSPQQNPHTPPTPGKTSSLKQPYDCLPTVPNAMYVGTTASISKGIPGNDRSWEHILGEEMDLPLQGPRIRVTHDISLRSDPVRISSRRTTRPNAKMVKTGKIKQ